MSGAPDPSARALDAAGRLLAIFDVFDQSFPKTDHLVPTRGDVERLATEAGVCDPNGFASQWRILMSGSIIAAGEGDPRAALRAQDVGVLLLQHASRARR